MNFALWVGQGAVVATALLLLYTIRLRWRLIHRRQRHERFVAIWRPLLAEVALGEGEALPERLPKLRRRDLSFFLHEWNVLHDSLRGAPTERLNRLARHYGIEKYAWKLLRRRGMASRLIATATLGHLRVADAWDRLLEQLDDDNPLLSLLSAAALVQIDAARAVPLLIPRIAERDDWPPARVASLLEDAEADIVSEPLREAILAASPAQTLRLLGFLDIVSRDVANTVVHELLERTDDEGIIAACLHVLDSPTELHHVRRLLNHPRWHIRMLAGSLLGQLGDEDDPPRLIRLLSDTEWWVRYRAAQALVELPFLGPNKLREIRDTHVDRFARDALRQAMAERGLA